MLRREDVVDPAASTKRVDVGVLQEQQCAVYLAIDNAGMELPLQVEADRVRDRSEPRRS